MAEWFKHKTVNFGNVGSIPTAPANIKLIQQINNLPQIY